jgi:hypothetical protein
MMTKAIGGLSRGMLSGGASSQPIRLGLLLLKPTATVPHKGGKRLDVDSLEYKILSEWIAAGTHRPDRMILASADSKLHPSTSAFGRLPASNSQFALTFPTGRRKTSPAGSSTDANAAVTQVDEQGRVSVMGFGEGAITAWYLQPHRDRNRNGPCTNQLASEIFARASRRNFIDDLVLDKLRVESSAIT